MHDTGNQDWYVSRLRCEAMRALPLSEGMRLIGGNIGVRILHMHTKNIDERARN
jgi:hypothetical protein